MPNPMDAILARIERGNQQRKMNALNDIFAKSYEPGAAIPFVDEQAQAMGLPQEPGMVAGYEPGRINEQNALARMVQSKDPGMALQAYQLQQQMDLRKAEQEKLRQSGMTAARTDAPYALRITDRLMDPNVSKEEKEIIWDVIRGNQTINTGGAQTIIGPRGEIRQALPVTPKPEQMPAFQGQQEAAKASAKSAVGIGEEEQKRSIKANSMMDYIGKADQLLNKASGSMLGAGYSKGKQMLGVSDDATKANQQLKLISGWMISNVPRMEGPQSDFDVKNYATMAGLVGDATVPIEDRRAALQTLTELQGKYAGREYAGVTDVTNQSAQKPTQYKVNGITKGPDGRMYVIRSLKPDGTPDEVILAK